MGGATNPIIGSLINGIGTNIAAGNDPVKGALMNASILAGSRGMNPSMASASPSVPTNVFASTGPVQQMGSSSAQSSFSLNQIPQIARDNPALTQFGLQTIQGLLQPEPMQQAQQGQVQRGQPLPTVDFAALLNPQQYKQQPISLLG